MASTPAKKPPALPLTSQSPGDYLLQEEALPTPPRLSQMLEDLESQAASELESYGDATFGAEWTGRGDTPRKEKVVVEEARDDVTWDPQHTKRPQGRVTPREDVRVEALERGCVKLRRDVRTVWILERNFEERMSRRVDGWAQDIRDMRDGVVTEIQDNQRRVVKEAMAEEAQRLDGALSRVSECEAENQRLRDRCAALEARIADLTDAEKRLDALEARCASNENNHASLTQSVDARFADQQSSLDKHRERIKDLSTKARTDAGRLSTVEAKAGPAHQALVLIQDRMAAMALCDDASSVAAKRPSDAREMASRFLQDDQLLREGDQGYGLLLRLSRPGAGSGEHLGKRRGVNLDAAVLAEQRRKSLEERRLNPEAPAPAPTVTGDATLYALGEHLRTIFDRVDINGAISASRGAAVPSRHRRDSCPSDELVGGFFFEFEAVRTDLTEMLRAGDGEISLVEAVKALRSDEDFAELLGFDGATKVNNRNKDRLSYALSEMDADGDKTISWDEFRCSILGLRNEAEPVLLIEDEELGGELDEDIGESYVDELLPTVIGDAILATYRRLDGLERSKADEEYCKTLESDIGRSNTKTDTVEKKLLEKLQIEKNQTNESLEKTKSSIEGLHEANGNTLLRVDEMKKMQQELSDALTKMDNDALSAVRDFLAPTIEKVKETAASLEKFSFTTEFKLTELHEKKESKKRVEKKAEIEVVDLKAEQKDLEATTSLVNVINQTLAEALKRLARAEDQIKPLKKATASLNTAVRDLRRHANPMAPKVKEEPTMEELHSQRGSRESRSSQDSRPQRSPRSLDPMPDRPKSPSFPPFPRSPRPRSPVHDNLMLHNMRMSWSRDGRRRDGSPDHSRRRVGFENDVPFVEDDPPRRVIPRRVKAPLGDVRRPESPWVDAANAKRDERLARDYPRSRTPSAPAGNTGGL